jgi:hypothetical protein
LQTGDRLHVAQLRIDSRGWRYRQREVKSGYAVPEPNGGPPCPTGGKPSRDGPVSSPGKVALTLSNKPLKACISQCRKLQETPWNPWILWGLLRKIWEA